MATLVIRGGRIIDPSQNVDRVGDLVIEDGRVVGIDVRASPDEVLDAAGLLVVPGLIDCQGALREPGFE